MYQVSVLIVLLICFLIFNVHKLTTVVRGARAQAYAYALANPYPVSLSASKLNKARR